MQPTGAGTPPPATTDTASGPTPDERPSDSGSAARRRSFGPVDTCFHHTDVETGRTCTRCGRPACHVCLKQASVGAHCFECVKSSAPSRRERVKVQSALGQLPPRVAIAMIIANLVVFLGTHDLGRFGQTSIRRTIVNDWATWGPAVDVWNEWWRIVSGGFLHFDIRHILMNMVMLFLLGRGLEQRVGGPRFAAVYAVSLLGGSAGALLMSPNSFTAGASGAVYGLMGAVFLVEKLSGGDPWRDGVGSLILINVVISFMIPNISIGGHLGGLVAGALAGVVLGDQRRRLTPRLNARVAASLLGLGVLAVGLALYGASTWTPV
jgi:membrane associated rhomboid family serine protease